LPDKFNYRYKKLLENFNFVKKPKILFVPLTLCTSKSQFKHESTDIHVHI
jgi:hypothetical protein